MKYYCILDDCGHLFNNLRGVKKHYEQVHGVTSDYKQYLKEFSLNNYETKPKEIETIENNDETSYKMPVNSGVIPQDIAQNLPDTADLSDDFKDFQSIMNIQKKKAKDMFIIAYYNKATRDLNNDADLMPAEINLDDVRDIIRQEKAQDQPINTMPQEQPSQNDLISNFIQLATPYLPAIIQSITKPAATGGGFPTL